MEINQLNEKEDFRTSKNRTASALRPVIRGAQGYKFPFLNRLSLLEGPSPQNVLIRKERFHE